MASARAARRLAAAASSTVASAGLTPSKAGTSMRQTTLLSGRENFENLEGTMIIAKAGTLEQLLTYRSSVSFPISGLTSMFNGSEQRYDLRLEAKRLNVVKNIFLEFRISMAGANSYVVPAIFFINRIEFRGDGGSGPIIQTINPMQILLRLLSLEKSELEEYASALGMTTELGQLDYPIVVGAASTRVFMLPLLGNWISAFNGVDFGIIQEDIMMQIFTRPTIITAGAGTATCTELNVIMIQSQAQTPELQNLAQREQLGKILTANILDFAEVRNNATIMAAGTQTLLTLDNVRFKKSPFIIVTVRASDTTVADNQLMRFIPLDAESSSTGTIDLQSSTGTSIFGSGTSVPVRRISNGMMAGAFPGNSGWIHAVYILPFTESVLKTLDGQIEGVYQFIDTAHRIAVTPSTSVPAFEVQTLTSAAVATAGYLWFEFMGEASAPVAFNATVGVLKAAVEAIPTFIEYPGGAPRVTFSATFAAAAAPTVTFADYRSYPLLRVHSPGATIAGAIGTVTTRTTVGKGFATGTTYSLEVSVAYFKKIDIVKGKVSVVELT